MTLTWFCLVQRFVLWKISMGLFYDWFLSRSTWSEWRSKRQRTWGNWRRASWISWRETRPERGGRKNSWRSWSRRSGWSNAGWLLSEKSTEQTGRVSCIRLVTFEERAWLCQNTVRWSNFDRLDSKMEVFLQSTEAIPCGHVLEWELTPENPPRTPCSWPPWPWFSCEKLLKIFEVS